MVLLPRERQFRRGVCVTNTKCYWTGQGDLNSAFNMAITQLMTLGKSFFPVFPPGLSSIE